jgi:UDP-N-acetyl-D-galactosamine dehydrogenase
VAILGITFKEDCPDSRNTRVVDIINELKEYEVNVHVIDPVADPDEVQREYGIQLKSIEHINRIDAVIFAVAHKEFTDLCLQDIGTWYREKDDFNGRNGPNCIEKVLIDVKGIFDKKEAEELDYLYWRL